MFKHSFCLALCVLYPTTSFALTSLERMVLQELTCDSAPHTLRILESLVQDGQIPPSDNIGYDSLSCWRFKTEIDIAGMRFTSLCAFEESPALHAAYPEFYYRGPGTSPGQTLSLGSAQSAEALSDWYLSLFGPGHVHSAIADQNESTLGDASEVSCTRWMLLPDDM